MNYNDCTKDELIRRINELELLSGQLLKEKEQETTLDFCWAGNLGHWYWDVKANKVTFNHMKITNLGYTQDEIPEEVNYQFFTDKLHSDDYKKSMTCMEDHLSGKINVYELEYRIQAKDGSYRWYYDRGKITKYNDKGEPIFVSGIVFDITERKVYELEIKDYNNTLLEISMTDALTSLRNRRAAMHYLSIEMCLSKTEPFSIALFDIDDFSLVNDSKGHLVGDKVLIKVGEIMEDIVRASDVVTRYGGEEFLIIYPKTSFKAARISSERIRRAVEEYTFDEATRITISGGIGQYRDETIEELIDKADQNLYKSKNQGKNKIN